ncbi:MAG: epoxyqueuosine reductase [Brevinematales bacterium]|nr:epoxyqueuosine reductase [Brevinematales bacterium]
MEIRNLIAPLLDKNIYTFGIGSIAGLLPEKYGAYNYAVSLLRGLDNPIIDKVSDGPTREYFDHYHTVNREIAETVTRIEMVLTDNGIPAFAVKPTVYDHELDDDYWKTLRVEVSHKMTATRAGLGWIGKTDLLITPEYGPRVRLGTVLFGYKGEIASHPIDESRCGKCILCVEKCPAGAATGALWDIHTDRDEYYNPFKCRETARRLSRERLDEEISLCGICVSVCPFGKGQTS